MKNPQKMSKHPKSTFCARKKLQMFECSMLEHMLALVFEPRLLLRKTQFTSGILLKVRILACWNKLERFFRTSVSSSVKRY